MAVSQMAMVAVMSMTPLYMRDQGQAELSTLVIAVHVFGMFGLSPLIGRWADRHGRIKALKRGALILGIGSLAAVIAGYVPALVFLGLFLVGVGWNFAFIAGSALLTESLPRRFEREFQLQPRALETIFPSRIKTLPCRSPFSGSTIVTLRRMRVSSAPAAGTVPRNTRIDNNRRA